MNTVKDSFKMLKENSRLYNRVVQERKCLEFEVPKVKDGPSLPLTPNSELRTQNAELILDADERGSNSRKNLARELAGNLWCLVGKGRKLYLKS
jgi:hypothetical protein